MKVEIEEDMEVVVAVHLENEGLEIREIVNITEDELRQFACNKARDKYGALVFTKIVSDEIEFNQAT